MPGQEAIDVALRHWLLRLLLKSPLDLHCRRNFSSGRAGQVRLEEGTFLLQPFLDRVLGQMHGGAACLEHHGDLPQIPSPQETQRHGFSYLVAAHNPL